MGIGSRADCSRVALTIRDRKLNIVVLHSENGAHVYSADEAILDRLVSCLCAVWLDSQGGHYLFVISPYFGDQLFELILNSDKEV